MLSGKGRCAQGSPPPAPLPTAQALHKADMALSWEGWETCGKTAGPPWPWHCLPSPPIPPRAFVAAQPAQGCQLLLFPVPWADSRYRQLRASPSQPQAHRKLGQHVGSCPNTDPDHVLEPGKRRGAYGRTAGSSTGSLGHPSTHSMGHKKTGRVPA